MLRTLAIDNYRSLRRLRVGLGDLTIVTGANGSGKSSLYRAFRLLADSSRNGAPAALAREGGVASARWAGTMGTDRAPGVTTGWQADSHALGPVAVRFGFGGDDFGYSIELGLEPPQSSMFGNDPQIKVEAVWAGAALRPATLLAERRGALVRARSDGEGWLHLSDQMQPFDSMLGQIADPERAPELMHVRELVRSWRFYDHFRTDVGAPVRTAQVGTRTPILSDDGVDLASALQTIREIGDGDALAKAIVEALPGSQLRIENRDGRFELLLAQPGLNRPLATAELSDGTLRFLLLAAALLSPRPPTLLVLNEPETSLHPELIPALATLMLRTSQRTQLVVVTHSAALVAALTEGTDDEAIRRVELVKTAGQTTIEGQRPLDEPAWHFPDR